MTWPIKPFQPAPRPDNVTDHDIESWTALFFELEAQYGETVPLGLDLVQALFPACKITPPLDSFLAAEWLRREMLGLGIDGEVVDMSCFALGQINRAALDPDPWGLAAAELEKARRGEFTAPGRELGDRLYRDQMVGLTMRYGVPGPKQREAARRMCEELRARGLIPEELLKTPFEK